MRRHYILFCIIISCLFLIIGCQSQTISPDDKVIKEFIKVNNIEAVDWVKFEHYRAIAFINEEEVGFYLDQTGNGDFSKHSTILEKGTPPQKMLGGFSDKYLVDFIADKDMAKLIKYYKTEKGTFEKVPNQRIYVYPTGAGIEYFDENNNKIDI